MPFGHGTDRKRLLYEKLRAFVATTDKSEDVNATSDVDSTRHPTFLKSFRIYIYIYLTKCEKESVTLGRFIPFLSLDLLDRATRFASNFVRRFSPRRNSELLVSLLIPFYILE